MGVCIIVASGHDGNNPLQVAPDLASAKDRLEKVGERVAEKVRADGCFDLVVFAIYETLEDGTLVQTWQFSDWDGEWEWHEVKQGDPYFELAEWRRATKQTGGHPAG